MFDEFLSELGEPAFELPRDYDEHVDGKPRLDGVRAFLAARGIEADEQLVHALAERKTALVLTSLRRDGVAVYDGSVRYVEAARVAGLDARSCPRARTPARSSGPRGSITSSRR